MRQGGLILAAGRVRSKEKKIAKTKPEKKKNSEKKSAAPRTHHEIHSSPATATTSRRRAMKHVLSIRPHSPASIDPGFVEVSLVHISQSAKTTSVTHTQTDTQTNSKTN